MRGRAADLRRRRPRRPGGADGPLRPGAGHLPRRGAVQQRRPAGEGDRSSPGRTSRACWTSKRPRRTEARLNHRRHRERQSKSTKMENDAASIAIMRHSDDMDISELSSLRSLCVLAVHSASAAEPQWTTYRGNAQRTGNTDGKPGPASPAVLWVHPEQGAFHRLADAGRRPRLLHRPRRLQRLDVLLLLHRPQGGAAHRSGPRRRRS